MSAIAWCYVTFGTLPQVAGVLYGVKPVVIAVVAQSMFFDFLPAMRHLALSKRAVSTGRPEWPASP